MEYRNLGTTSLKVSSLCLGTMTWGERNSESEAHSQLDLALDYGINFIDTAEMYPSPPQSHTYGLTEKYIGTWKNLKKNRDKIILASKIIGPMPSATYIRNGATKFDRKNIVAALEESLKRLNVDYLDLYQLHWPERQSNFFGKLGFNPDTNDANDEIDNSFTPVQEILETLKEIQKSGKVRHFGVSNETPWGLMKYLSLAEASPQLPRMESIQNPYNLLNRTFEIGLSEISYREKCGLLAYSPLAFGILTGKYLNGERPNNARLTRWPHYTRYTNSQSLKAAECYIALAKKFGVNPIHLALQFVTSQSFVTSNIIGATSLEQLKENIESLDFNLTNELITLINNIHQEFPNPAP